MHRRFHNSPFEQLLVLSEVDGGYCAKIELNLSLSWLSRRSLVETKRQASEQNLAHCSVWQLTFVCSSHGWEDTVQKKSDQGETTLRQDSITGKFCLK
jgi:hypothetical protein